MSNIFLFYMFSLRKQRCDLKSQTENISFWNENFKLKFYFPFEVDKDEKRFFFLDKQSKLTCFKNRFLKENFLNEGWKNFQT